MIGRIASYAWASPNTLLGLVAGGRHASLRRPNPVDLRGVVELCGGMIGSMLTTPAVACPYHALTLGHVILATDQAALDCSREHEHVHVRQYEAWGPFFLPAYFASSFWQLLLGRRCYRDNYFERQAFDRS